MFGAPLRLDDAAGRTLASAKRMRAALAKLNAKNQSRQKPEIAFGVGIHFGEALVGNIGTIQHMKYGVMGDTVNIASRLEALTKELGHNILISDTVRDRILDLSEMIPLGEKKLKDREAGIQIYGIP